MDVQTHRVIAVVAGVAITDVEGNVGKNIKMRVIGFPLMYGFGEQLWTFSIIRSLQAFVGVEIQIAISVQ